MHLIVPSNGLQEIIIQVGTKEEEHLPIVAWSCVGFGGPLQPYVMLKNEIILFHRWHELREKTLPGAIPWRYSLIELQT